MEWIALSAERGYSNRRENDSSLIGKGIDEVFFRGNFMIDKKRIFIMKQLKYKNKIHHFRPQIKPFTGSAGTFVQTCSQNKFH
jgi:hypothetical protein